MFILTQQLYDHCFLPHVRLLVMIVTVSQAFSGKLFYSCQQTTMTEVKAWLRKHTASKKKCPFWSFAMCNNSTHNGLAGEKKRSEVKTEEGYSTDIYPWRYMSAQCPHNVRTMSAQQKETYPS